MSSRKKKLKKEAAVARARQKDATASPTARSSLDIAQAPRFLRVNEFASSRRRDVQQLVDAATSSFQPPSQLALSSSSVAVAAFAKSLASALTGADFTATQKMPRHLRRRAASHRRYNTIPVQMQSNWCRKQRKLKDNNHNHAGGGGGGGGDGDGGLDAHRKTSIEGLSRRTRRRRHFVRHQQNCVVGAPLTLATHVWHAKRCHMQKPPASWGPWLSLPVRRADRGVAAALRDATDASLLYDESFCSFFHLCGKSSAVLGVLAARMDPSQHQKLVQQCMSLEVQISSTSRHQFGEDSSRRSEEKGAESKVTNMNILLYEPDQFPHCLQCTALLVLRKQVPPQAGIDVALLIHPAGYTDVLENSLGSLVSPPSEPAAAARADGPSSVETVEHSELTVRAWRQHPSLQLYRLFGATASHVVGNALGQGAAWKPPAGGLMEQISFGGTPKRPGLNFLVGAVGDTREDWEQQLLILSSEWTHEAVQERKSERSVVTMWQTLIQCSIKGGSRVVGMEEVRALNTVTGRTTFPWDFPDTNAGAEIEQLDRAVRVNTDRRRPRGKRLLCEKGVDTDLRMWERVFLHATDEQGSSDDQFVSKPSDGTGMDDAMRCEAGSNDEVDAEGESPDGEDSDNDANEYEHSYAGRGLCVIRAPYVAPFWPDWDVAYSALLHGKWEQIAHQLGCHKRKIACCSNRVGTGPSRDPGTDMDNLEQFPLMDTMMDSLVGIQVAVVGRGKILEGALVLPFIHSPKLGSSNCTPTAQSRGNENSAGVEPVIGLISHGAMSPVLGRYVGSAFVEAARLRQAWDRSSAAGCAIELPATECSDADAPSSRVLLPVRIRNPRSRVDVVAVALQLLH